MSQTITLPIALGSKAYALTSKFNYENGRFEGHKITNITITEVVISRNGTVRHYISGNFKYLPGNVFGTMDEAQNALVSRSESTESA